MNLKYTAMKKLATIFLSIFISLISVNGQTKKELEVQVADLKSEIATMNADSEKIKAEVVKMKSDQDSTSKMLEIYMGMYDVIQKKVLPYDFKPEDMEEIIDSLQGEKESNMAQMMKGSEQLRDTIGMLNTKIDSQTVEIAKLKERNAELNSPLDKLSDDQVKELKKVKDLLDAGILNKEEFNARKKMILKLE